MFNVMWRRWIGVFTNGSRRPTRRKPQPFQYGFRPLLETLEERLTPTSTPQPMVITPTTFSDLAISSLGDVNSQGQILDQGNAITLRSAIIAANENSTGTETIDLNAGTYTLTQGPGDDDTVDAAAQLTGDLDIVNSNSGTTYNIISAWASSQTVIDGGGIDRIRRGRSFGGSQLNLTIQGVTLQNGIAASPNGAGGDGGAIRFNGENLDGTAAGTLTLTDVQIDNNQSTDNVAGGVEVFGSADFTNCVFSDNTANGGGGGAFVDNGIPGSTLTISNCSFTGNQVLDSNFGTGGAILLQGGTTLSIDKSVITGNQAGADGGGISILNAGDVTITNTIIADNSAGSSSGNGGGVAVNNTPPFDTSTVALNDNLIAGNTAFSGTGLAYVAGTAAVDATDNFWGSNANPSTVSNLITDTAGAGVTSNPWLELAVAPPRPASVELNGTSIVTADLDRTDSSGDTVASLPPTIPIAFASADSLGTLNPPSTNLAAGSATSTYTAGAITGTDSVTATLEGSQPIGTNIAVAPSAAPTTTTVTSSPSGTSSYGTSVTFTATVTVTSNSDPVGSAGAVSFDIDGMPYGMATDLNGSGQASFTIDSLPVTINPHDITAFYSGVTNEFASSEGDADQAITPAPLTVTAGSTIKTYGQTQGDLRGH